MEDSKVSCPLCNETLALSALNRHIRLEIRYCGWRCGLCRVKFLVASDGAQHFSADFGSHPGQAEFVIEDLDKGKETRVRDLLRAAFDASSLCPPLEDAADCSLNGADELQEMESEDESPLKPLSEESAPMPSAADCESESESVVVDQKPTKAELSGLDGARTDGKVACLLCGLATLPNFFKAHAVRKHLGFKPFACNLCPVSDGQRSKMRQHMIRRHGEAEAESFSDLQASMGHKIRDVIDACFGDLKTVARLKLTCPCGQSFTADAAKRHIVAQHMKQVVYTCALCAFTSADWYPTALRRHLKSAHGANQLSDDNHVNHQDRLKPTLESLCRQLLGL